MELIRVYFLKEDKFNHKIQGLKSCEILKTWQINYEFVWKTNEIGVKGNNQMFQI